MRLIPNLFILTLQVAGNVRFVQKYIESTLLEDLTRYKKVRSPLLKQLLVLASPAPFIVFLPIIAHVQTPYTYVGAAEGGARGGKRMTMADMCSVQSV